MFSMKYLYQDKIGNYCISTARFYWTALPVVSAVLIVAHLEEDSPVDEDDEADVVGPVVRVGTICELLEGFSLKIESRNPKLIHF